VADIVAIEQEGVAVHQVERFFDLVGDGRFARSRQTREPQDTRLLVLEISMNLAAGPSASSDPVPDCSE
jgi:hypothetical protein